MDRQVHGQMNSQVWPSRVGHSLESRASTVTVDEVSSANITPITCHPPLSQRHPRCGLLLMTNHIRNDVEEAG